MSHSQSILHRNERELIRILYRENRPMSIKEVSVMAGMSWITAKKYLYSIHEKNIVEEYLSSGSLVKKDNDNSKRKRFVMKRDLLRELSLRKKRSREVESDEA